MCLKPRYWNNKWRYVPPEKKNLTLVCVFLLKEWGRIHGKESAEDDQWGKPSKQPVPIPRKRKIVIKSERRPTSMSVVAGLKMIWISKRLRTAAKRTENTTTYAEETKGRLLGGFPLQWPHRGQWRFLGSAWSVLGWAFQLIPYAAKMPPSLLCMPSKMRVFIQICKYGNSMLTI